MHYRSSLHKQTLCLWLSDHHPKNAYNLTTCQRFLVLYEWLCLIHQKPYDLSDLYKDNDILHFNNVTLDHQDTALFIDHIQNVRLLKKEIDSTLATIADYISTVITNEEWSTFIHQLDAVNSYKKEKIILKNTHIQDTLWTKKDQKMIKGLIKQYPNVDQYNLFDLYDTVFIIEKNTLIYAKQANLYDDLLNIAKYEKLPPLVYVSITEHGLLRTSENPLRPSLKRPI